MMKETKEAASSYFYCKFFGYTYTTGSSLIVVLFLKVLLDIFIFDLFNGL